MKGIITFILATLLLVVGCSKEDESIINSNEAPSVANQEFKFYKGNNLNWSFKVLPASDPTSSIITINSTTAQVNGTGNFYYKKINSSQAVVSCFFMTRIPIGGYIIGQWNQYEITLTFLSANHGKFEGKQLYNPEDSGTTISGTFVYNSDKEIIAVR